MSFLKKLLGLQHVWRDGESPCPGCGRHIRLLKGPPVKISAVEIDTGQVRTGLQCQKCGTLYHNYCSSTQCFCGSTSFNDVIISHETPPLYSQYEHKNCPDCGLMRRFCRCDFYAKWEKQ